MKAKQSYLTELFLYPHCSTLTQIPMPLGCFILPASITSKYFGMPWEFLRRVGQGLLMDPVVSSSSPHAA